MFTLEDRLLHFFGDLLLSSNVNCTMLSIEKHSISLHLPVKTSYIVVPVQVGTFLHVSWKPKIVGRIMSIVDHAHSG